MTPQVWVAIVIGIAATVEDLVHRQISNWICGAALLAGVVLHVVSGGWRGGLSALLGSAVGLCVFLIFYLLGGMGGGDVKLMAGFGAVLGVKQLLEAALWTAGCGGLEAGVVIAASQLRQFWAGRKQVHAANAAVSDPEIRTRRESIPYAPAIAIGV